MTWLASLARPRLRAAALLTGPAVVAGLACSSPSIARTARGAAGLASESPAQIIGAAQRALRSAHGYVVAGRITQSRQKLGLRLAYGGPTRLEIQLTQRTGTVAVIVLPGGLFVRANRAYWRAHGGTSTLRFANRWIKLPAHDSAAFTRQLGHFNPRTLATCLGENHGPLTRTGTAVVNGRRVVVVRDAGGVPGSNPGTYDVALQGPAYPLRVTATGPTRRGGRVSVCNDGRGGNTEGTLTLSRFNHPPAITAPTHPLSVGSTAP